MEDRLTEVPLEEMTVAQLDSAADALEAIMESVEGCCCGREHRYRLVRYRSSTLGRDIASFERIDGGGAQ